MLRCFRQLHTSQTSRLLVNGEPYRTVWYNETNDAEDSYKVSMIEQRPVTLATETLLENADGVIRPHRCSRGGTLLPSLYADARYVDAVIVSQAVAPQLCRR